MADGVVWGDVALTVALLATTLYPMRPWPLLTLLTACAGGAAVGERTQAQDSAPFAFQRSLEPVLFRSADLEPSEMGLDIVLSDQPFDCGVKLADHLDAGAVIVSFRVPLGRASFSGTYDRLGATLITERYGARRLVFAELSEDQDGYAGALTFVGDGDTYEVQIDAPSCGLAPSS